MKGKYIPQNPEKVIGDPRDIITRSFWERGVCRFCDLSSDVIAWGSEIDVVPYRCKTDNKVHRYFVDFRIVYKNGTKMLIEVKPASQCQPPKAKRNRLLFEREVMRWAKNVSKWEAAKKYAERKGMIFKVWDETVLKQLGIKILLPMPPRKRYRHVAV